MQLSDWLQQERGRGAALARHLRIPASMVARIAAGQKRVPLDRCPYIQEFTGGAVTCEELRPDATEYFALIRRMDGQRPLSNPTLELSLVDRRERAVPIDFPERRRPSGDEDRKAA